MSTLRLLCSAVSDISHEVSSLEGQTAWGVWLAASLPGQDWTFATSASLPSVSQVGDPHLTCAISSATTFESLCTTSSVPKDSTARATPFHSSPCTPHQCQSCQLIWLVRRLTFQLEALQGSSHDSRSCLPTFFTPCARASTPIGAHSQACSVVFFEGKMLKVRGKSVQVSYTRNPQHLMHCRDVCTSPMDWATVQQGQREGTASRT